MGKTRSALARFSVPLVAYLLLLVPASIYYFFYTQSQKEYFSARNFRQLTVMSEQVRFTLNNYRNIFENASTKEDPKKFLESFVKELKDVRVEYAKPAGGGPGTLAQHVETTPFFITLANQNGAWHISLVYMDNVRGIRIHAHRDIRDMISSFPGAEVFDDVLLASDEGAIVYQGGKSSLRFTSLDGLQLPSPQSASASTPKTASPAPRASLRGASRLFTGFEISGKKYDVYLQPLPIGYTDGNGKSSEWTLCALVRSRRFLAESLAISYDLIISFVLLSVLLLLTLPVVRLKSLTEWESLRLRDIVSLFVCTGCIASLAVLLGLHLYHFEIRESKSSPLEPLSRSVNEEIRKELQQISLQLKAFCDSDRLWNQIAAHSADRNAERPPGPLSTQQQESSTRIGPLLEHYPHLNFAVWADQAGWQWIKWDVRHTVTPFINIDERLQGLKQGDPWHLPADNGSAFLPFRLELVFSQNTGEYIANYVVRTRTCIAQPADEQRAAIYKQDPLITRGYAYIATELRSLIRPVLPPGVGFALVDQSGKTLAHSDAIRNQWENFFVETDEDDKLRAAVLARDITPLHIRYQGRDHEAFITPVLSDMPYSLIVFRDVTNLRTMHLETQTLAGLLLVPYLGLMALAGALSVYLSSRNYPAEWVWPNSDYAKCYRGNTISCGLLLITMAVWIVFARSPELYFSVVAIGSVAGVMTVIVLKSRCTQARPIWALGIMLAAVALLSFLCFADPAKALLLPVSLAAALFIYYSRPLQGLIERSWGFSTQSSYALAATLLMAVVGVLPSIACFKIAHDLELGLLVRSAQIGISNAARDKIAAARKKFEERRENSDAFASDSVFLQPYISPFGTAVKFGTPREPGEETHHVTAFEKFLTAARVAYNRGVRQTSGVPLTQATENWTWVNGPWPTLQYRSRPDAADALVVQTSFHPLVWLTSLAGVQETLPSLAFWTVLSCLTLTGVFLYVRYFVTRLTMPEIAAARPERSPLPAIAAAAAAGGSHTAESGEGWPATVARFRDAVQTNPQCSELVAIFEREFETTDTLRQIGKEIAEDCSIATATPATLLYAALDCDAHYKSLWRSLSTREHFVLYHLAADGLVNPRNSTVLHRLIRAGLVVPRPRFEIFNESFRLYILGHVRPIEASAWANQRARHSSHSTRTLVLVLLLALIVFLFLTQPELVQTSVGLLTALAAALGALMKLLPPGPAPQEK
jgi:hypothetical protein